MSPKSAYTCAKLSWYTKKGRFSSMLGQDEQEFTLLTAIPLTTIRGLSASEGDDTLKIF